MNGANGACGASAGADADGWPVEPQARQALLAAVAWKRSCVRAGVEDGNAIAEATSRRAAVKLTRWTTVRGERGAAVPVTCFADFTGWEEVVTGLLVGRPVVATDGASELTVCVAGPAVRETARVMGAVVRATDELDGATDFVTGRVTVPTGRVTLVVTGATALVTGATALVTGATARVTGATALVTGATARVTGATT